MSANFWESSQWRNMEEYRTKPIGEKRDPHVVQRDASVLKTDEADSLKLYFAKCVFGCCKRLQTSILIAATAATYLKRFYLRCSLRDHNPAVIAPACILLATKVEEVMVWPQEIAKKWDMLGKERSHNWGVAPDHIIQMECELLNVLQDSLIVFHPYRPLQMFLENSKATDCTCSAWHLVNDSFYISDVCLANPPYVIALASLYMGTVMQEKDVRQWYESIHVDSTQVAQVMQELLKGYDIVNRSTFRGAVASGIRKLSEAAASAKRDRGK